MNERLSLQDLIDLLAKRQEITKKDAESFLRELIALISETIEDNETVKIKDFGTFKLVKVSARKSVDINTGEAIEIAPHYKLNFTPDKTLKEAVNRPFAHFESVVLEEGVSFDNIENEMESDDLNEQESIIEEDLQTEDISIDKQKHIKEQQETHPETASLNIDIIESQEASEATESEIQIPIIAEDQIVNNTQEQQDTKIAIDEKYPDKTPEDTESQLKEGRKKAAKRRRRLISLGFFIFLILAGFLVGGLYFQEIARFITDGPADKDNSIAISTTENKGTTTNDNIVLPVDSLKEKQDTISDAKANLPQQVNADIPLATETIKAGHTLRNISLHYYGHKSFWIYIYEENKDAIKNPNNVPIGTKLTIPSPTKYAIDAKSKESVEKAIEKERQLFNKLGI